METVYFGNTENVRDCNITVGVRFDGNEKMYHYGAYLDEEVVDALKGVDGLVTNLYVSGKGRKNGSAVKIVELDYTRVSKSASRAIDYIDEIKLAAGVLRCNGKRIDTSETVKIRQVDNPDGKTFGSVVEKIKTKKTEKESDDTMAKNTMFGEAGKQLKGVLGISLLDQSPVVKIGDTFLSFNKETKAVMEVMDEMVMKLDFMPAILMPTLSTQVFVGDVISVQGKLSLVGEVENGVIKLIEEDGTKKEYAPVGNMMFGGMTYITKLINPMEGMMGGMQNPNGGMNPALMFAMAGNDGSSGEGMEGMAKAFMMMSMMGGMQQPQMQMQTPQNPTAWGVTPTV